MSRFFLNSILMVLALGATVVNAQEPAGLGSHVFFKHLIGEWKAEGVLKAADGSDVKITEDWKGSAAADGTFVMEGTRKINDSEQGYTWTIAFVNGLYEVSYLPKADGAKPIRFEASISDVALTMQLSGFLGDDGNKVTILDSFPGEDRATLDSQVTLANKEGVTTLSGHLIHKKVK